MKIYTGYFAKQKFYEKNGLIPVSIARYNRWYSGAELKKLAPPSNMIHDPEHIYTPKFNNILSRLNKSEILDDLKTIGKGKSVILLCYERPDDFCHRQLVAKWLGENCEGEFYGIQNSLF